MPNIKIRALTDLDCSRDHGFTVENIGDAGLFIDGKVGSTWLPSAIELDTVKIGVAERMCEEAFEEGKAARTLEIKLLREDLRRLEGDDS